MTAAGVLSEKKLSRGTGEGAVVVRKEARLGGIQRRRGGRQVAVLRTLTHRNAKGAEAYRDDGQAGTLYDFRKGKIICDMSIFHMHLRCQGGKAAL